MKQVCLWFVVLMAAALGTSCRKPYNPYKRLDPIPATGEGYSLPRELKNQSNTLDFVKLEAKEPLICSVGKKVTFKGSVSTNVVKIEVWVDRYHLQNVTVQKQKFEFSYAFTTAGTQRKLQLLGFDKNRKKIASATYTLDVKP